MPDNDGGVTKKLAGAKKALTNADNSNVSTRNGKPFGSATPGAGAAKPTVKKPGILDGLKKMADQRTQESQGTADSLKAKQENVDAYKKVVEGEEAPMPKMHKGGKVKEDGPHNLKKGEVVLTEKDAKKKGVEDGMKEEKEKHSKKKHKKHKFSRTEIEHHEDGSHTVRHHPMMQQQKEGMQPEQPVSYAAPDMASLHAGMDQNLGEGALEQGAGAAPAAPAGAAQ